MYHNTQTLWNTQAGICTIHGMVLINIFLITASDEGQYQLKYPFWDWFPDKSRLQSLYWSASQLEDLQNSVCIYAIENHPNLIYRVSQEECEILRESVPYVKLYWYNSKHLYPKLNGYGENGQRKVWTSCISAYCISTAVGH